MFGVGLTFDGVGVGESVGDGDTDFVSECDVVLFKDTMVPVDEALRLFVRRLFVRETL